MMSLAARCLVEGEAEGNVAHWSTPLSFWGGFDGGERPGDRGPLASGLWR